MTRTSGLVSDSLITEGQATSSDSVSSLISTVAGIPELCAVEVMASGAQQAVVIGVGEI